MRAPIKTLAIAAFIALGALRWSARSPSARRPRPSPASAAPAFRAPDIAGKTVGLADYAGQDGRPRMDQ